VPDNHLSLAIGKEGQNARLAARLTGWRIDIKSQEQMAQLLAKEAFERATPKEDKTDLVDNDSSDTPDIIGDGIAPKPIDDGRGIW